MDHRKARHMEVKVKNVSPSKKQGKSLSSRIRLDYAASEITESWLSTIKSQLIAPRITKTDLVNWLIIRHGKTLSSAELSDLKAKTFEPVAALEKLVNELKSGSDSELPKTDGDLARYVSSFLQPRRQKVRKSKKRSLLETLPAVKTTEHEDKRNVNT